MGEKKARYIALCVNAVELIAAAALFTKMIWLPADPIAYLIIAAFLLFGALIVASVFFKPVFYALSVIHALAVIELLLISARLLPESTRLLLIIPGLIVLAPYIYYFITVGFGKKT